MFVSGVSCSASEGCLDIGQESSRFTAACWTVEVLVCLQLHQCLSICKIYKLVSSELLLCCVYAAFLFFLTDVVTMSCHYMASTLEQIAAYRYDHHEGE